jgi:hypothetical protein
VEVVPKHLEQFFSYFFFGFHVFGLLNCATHHRGYSVTSFAGLCAASLNPVISVIVFQTR